MNDKRRFNGEGELVVKEPEPQKYDIETLHGWVLIRKIENQERIKDGVLIPGGGKSSRGVVVSTPADTGLSVGDIVIFTNFSILLEDLEEVTGDRELQLVRFEEVYARIRPCT